MNIDDYNTIMSVLKNIKKEPNLEKRFKHENYTFFIRFNKKRIISLYVFKNNNPVLSLCFFYFNEHDCESDESLNGMNLFSWESDTTKTTFVGSNIIKQYMHFNEEEKFQHHVSSSADSIYSMEIAIELTNYYDI